MPLSLRGATWHVREADERLARTLAQHHNLHESLARILALRGITLEQIESFLDPKLKTSLPDPLHLKDMEKAAMRLARAIEERETIALFADYDVDGATSAALFTRFLRALGCNPLLYIPDRILEGYGPNIQAFEQLRQQGATLCLTLDCGAMAHDPIRAAHALGMEVLVIDHHLGAETLPEAYAVVNPNRHDETSAYTYLAAVGVSFLTLIATRSVLTRNGFFTHHTTPDLFALLDCVALGTVCDVMPLIGLNRAFVSQGLKILHTRQNVGLKTLADSAKINTPPRSYHLGFILGPRINAGGRVGRAHLGATLLATENTEEATHIAIELERYNTERKAIEELVLTEAIQQIEARSELPAMLVISGEGWHQGVIGIVAGRLKERYHRPTAVLSLDAEKNIGKASVRSIEGIDIGRILATAKNQGLLLSGGGHAMAAGFSIAIPNLPALEAFLEEQLAPMKDRCGKPVLNLDCSLSISGITLELIERLEALGPFGAGNPEPRILLSNVYAYHASLVGTDHIRVRLGDHALGTKGAGHIAGIAFRAANEPFGQALLNAGGKKFHIAGKLDANTWQGKTTPQIHIEDVMEA